MKTLRYLFFALCLGIAADGYASDIDAAEFAKTYFEAWAGSQKPDATAQDLENYLALLTDDVGHQHLPYDPDDERLPDGKEAMREGMTYYLGAHTEYTGTLLEHMGGQDVVIIRYDTHSKGVHPQTGDTIERRHVTIEVLEIEDGRVSVIRKYND